eukprot:gnl/MRDRNA2_/MRDRNA2_57949_c0_seq2.p1 gnl/MRDRNA2_/MRDRNA2_57949_c0~~gnl/MRDRNA2_/MRDRNA2_57949_c0_seq2.p1  ORF type:complete len:158 (+),score=26.76 gnl/MRDRNA2_/MRDRNA2_57949_c0_seq2:23-475(+)
MDHLKVTCYMNDLGSMNIAMRIIVVINLMAFVIQTQGKGLVKRLENKMFDRFQKMWWLHHSDLHHTTLAKSMLGPASIGLGRWFPSYRSMPLPASSPQLGKPGELSIKKLSLHGIQPAMQASTSADRALPQHEKMQPSSPQLEEATFALG